MTGVNLTRFILALAFCTVINVKNAQADQSVIRIPLRTVTKPAADLLDSKGQPLSFAEVIQMHQKGFDTSLLQPKGDDYWQNKKFDGVDQGLITAMPSKNSEVLLDGYLGANRELGLYSVYVTVPGKSDEKYILSLGLQVHASLLRSGLLRKLGYYQLSPKYVSKIKLNFSSKDEKQKFIRTAFCENGPDEDSSDCLSLAPFKTDGNKREFLSDAGEKSLYVHGVYLEKMSNSVPSLFDGLLNLSSGQLLFASQNRTVRSLAVPFVLADFQESLNRVTVQPVFIRDGWAFINYSKSYYFDNTAYDDIRWVLRRVAELNDSDWDQIVTAGQYPESLRQLVKAKLMLRAKNMIESFFLPNEKVQLSATIPELEYSSGDGYVVKGKVVNEYIAGYPQRFSHGQRQSPFESADIARYMKIRLQSSAIEMALGQLTEKLKLVQTQILSSQSNGFELTDRGLKPLGSIVGLQSGVNFGASRIVTTGTFYGSTAPVQLVDNVSVSVGIGVMKLIDDVGGLRSNFGANVGYNRDYTHVRPLDSIKETKNIPWKDLFVPSKLKDLASPLKDGKLTDFVSALKMGEVFTITDSVAVMGRAGVDLGLDGLISISSAVQPSIGLSASAGKVILRQTQITRTDKGFQIFIRDQNSKVFNITLDANYFINLMRIKMQTQKTDLHTDVFILNFNGDFISKGENGEFNFDESPDLKAKYEKQKKIGSQIAAALRALIFDSNTEQLYINFKKQQFEIDHNLKTKEIQTKLLWFRASQLEEEHLLKVFKPEVIVPDNAAVVNTPVEIVTFRKGELRGRDILGFGLEVADGVLKNKLGSFAPQLSKDAQNPSQMPFGRAEWRIVRTDTDLHPERPGALPSVGLVQNVWGGWSLKKKDFNAILKQIQNRLAGTGYESQRLIPDKAFYQVEKIDFFRVTSNLSLLPGALVKIKELMITPDITQAKVDKPKFLGKLFAKLSQVGKNNKQRPEDQMIFKNILTMMGQGNEEYGKQLYMSECQVQKMHQMNNGETYGTQTHTGSWVDGTYYECLMPWTEKIIQKSREFIGADLRKQNRIMTELVYILEEKISLTVILKALERENYLFFIEVTGFRTGDEDADEGVYVSNILGEPEKKHPYSNGLINILAEKSQILPIELDRSQGSFQ